MVRVLFGCFFVSEDGRVVKERTTRPRRTVSSQTDAKGQKGAAGAAKRGEVAREGVREKGSRGQRCEREDIRGGRGRRRQRRVEPVGGELEAERLASRRERASVEGGMASDTPPDMDQRARPCRIPAQAPPAIGCCRGNAHRPRRDLACCTPPAASTHHRLPAQCDAIVLVFVVARRPPSGCHVSTDVRTLLSSYSSAKGRTEVSSRWKMKMEDGRRAGKGREATCPGREWKGAGPCRGPISGGRRAGCSFPRRPA